MICVIRLPRYPFEENSLFQHYRVLFVFKMNRPPTTVFQSFLFAFCSLLMSFGKFTSFLVSVGKNNANVVHKKLLKHSAIYSALPL